MEIKDIFKKPFVGIGLVILVLSFGFIAADEQRKFEFWKSTFSSQEKLNYLYKKSSKIFVSFWKKVT